MRSVGNSGSVAAVNPDGKSGRGCVELDDEVSDDIMADCSQDAFGVELDALDRVVGVPDAHDEFGPVVVSGGSDVEALRNVLGD